MPAQLVDNVDTPGVYAFWYNPARAIHHRSSADATHLLAVSILVPRSMPHCKALEKENVVLSYSMSPLVRESIKPKWHAKIGEPYGDPKLGWALLELEFGKDAIGKQVQTCFHPLLREGRDPEEVAEALSNFKLSVGPGETIELHGPRHLQSASAGVPNTVV